MPGDDSRALAPADFPQSVRDSLAALRRLSRDVKSREEWLAIGRRATPDEIALAEAERQPHSCAATSIRTGLPCTKSRVLGMKTCRAHGGATKQAIAQAERRLREIVNPVLARLYELAMQSEHLPSATNAARDLLDRVGLGAVVQSRVRASMGDGEKIVVQIGFLNPPAGAEPVIIAPAKRPEKP